MKIYLCQRAVAKKKKVYISQISFNSMRLLDWENRVGEKGVRKEIGEAERAKQSKTGNFTGKWVSLA